MKPRFDTEDKELNEDDQFSSAIIQFAITCFGNGDSDEEVKKKVQAAVEAHVKENWDAEKFLKYAVKNVTSFIMASFIKREEAGPQEDYEDYEDLDEEEWEDDWVLNLPYIQN